MNWIGAIFLAALIAVVFAIYSDVTMAHCEANSFFGEVGLCKPFGKKIDQLTRAAFV
jgi:hypothetical protein